VKPLTTVNAELINAPILPSTLNKTSGRENTQSEEEFLATAPLDQVRAYFEKQDAGASKASYVRQHHR